MAEKKGNNLIANCILRELTLRNFASIYRPLIGRMEGCKFEAAGHGRIRMVS